MVNLFKTHNGMNIVGQGGKIILFVLPSLMAAIWVHAVFPQIAALPEQLSFIRPVGYLFLLPGLILWSAAVTQLILGFSNGQLVTTGAYGVVRNPIYSSAAFFILPGVGLITLTWVYWVVSVFLYLGVTIFIGKEEQQLTQAFGQAYEDYMAKVDRLIPFKNLALRQALSYSITGHPELERVRKFLLLCGILASLVWLGTDILAALRYEGYRYPTQVISDLTAVGASTRSFVNRFAPIYTVLKIAFAIGIWLSAGSKRALRITAAALFAFGVVDLAAYAFPLKPEEALGSFGNIMHGILAGGAAVILIMLSIGLGASVDGRWFRLYSYGTLLIMIVSGSVMAFLDAPQMDAISASQAPTWFGLTERINAYGFMLWIMLLSTVLMRTQPESLALADREKSASLEAAANRA